MTYKEYKTILKCDRLRIGINNHMYAYIKNAGYRIITHYRRCQFFRSYRCLYLLYIIQRIIYNHKCNMAGCDIPSHVEIGKGFRIDHTQGIVINSKVKIGEGCTIKSGTVIGRNDRGTPVIGSNVMIGVHAIVLGNITIGDNVDIGAGAIVTHDVPNSAVIIGEAAHIYRIKGDNNE